MAETPSAADRRGSDREQIATLMPVSLIVRLSREKERLVSGCLYDVAAEGLCLILREELTEGASATLVTVNERIAFVVAWVTKDAERAYRCGLRLTESRPDLRALFSGHVHPRSVI